MSGPKSFYQRYWQDEHIKVNPFDHHPGEWTRENFDHHMDFFRPYTAGQLLDFGCGDGQFSHLIRPYCRQSHGVDISEAAIAKASESYPDIPFQTINGEGRLPYEDAAFDTVCAMDVFEHILDTESLLEEFYRVLKPGGRLLLATNELTRAKLLIITVLYFNDYFYPASPHIRYFTRKSLADLLQRKQFRVIDYRKNRTYLGFIPHGQMVVAEKQELPR